MCERSCQTRCTHSGAAGALGGDKIIEPRAGSVTVGYEHASGLELWNRLSVELTTCLEMRGGKNQKFFFFLLLLPPSSSFLSSFPSFSSSLLLSFFEYFPDNSITGFVRAQHWLFSRFFSFSSPPLFFIYFYLIYLWPTLFAETQGGLHRARQCNQMLQGIQQTGLGL